MQDLKALEQVLGHTFKDPYLLQTALTHTSFANEARHGTKHNERLEFLGRLCSVDCSGGLSVYA